MDARTPAPIGRWPHRGVAQGPAPAVGAPGGLGCSSGGRRYTSAKPGILADEATLRDYLILTLSSREAARKAAVTVSDVGALAKTNPR